MKNNPKKINPLKTATAKAAIDGQDWKMSLWHHLIPDSFVCLEGHKWEGMPCTDRERETWINPKLRRILPKWWRDQRAKVLRANRKTLARVGIPDPLGPSPDDHSLEPAPKYGINPEYGPPCR
ncbi:MAG: hypothetical protein ACPGOY_18715 [Rhodospirillaceae bacterium]